MKFLSVLYQQLFSCSQSLNFRCPQVNCEAQKNVKRKTPSMQKWPEVHNNQNAQFIPRFQSVPFSEN